ncbi:TniB family NTP-binding protein [Neisseria polysaccharea]|uniref:TniB family NTP-binding protein n=1 Tax=Neisseria polysaccharea TaxID=489 RepID=UPI0018C4290A
MNYPHLSPKAAEQLNLDDLARIEYIRSPRWIGYPQAQQILTKLEDLLVFPKQNRMPNMLLVGDTNNGKTMLVSHFLRQHPAHDNPNGTGIIAPVVLIQAPPTPDESRFYNAILDLLFAPYKAHDRTDKKLAQVLHLLKYINTKMLIIDEIHHILSGSLNKQKAFLNVIKYMGNELQIPIVGVGIKDAYRAIQTDSQLANRFEPAVLPRWEMDKNFLRLLMSFERMLPLKQPSNLHEISLATRLYSMSEGYIGELSRLLTQAAVTAIQQKTECINEPILQSINWISPSQRKRQLDKLL